MKWRGQWQNHKCSWAELSGPQWLWNSRQLLSDVFADPKKGNAFGAYLIYLYNSMDKIMKIKIEYPRLDFTILDTKGKPQSHTVLNQLVS